MRLKFKPGRGDSNMAFVEFDSDSSAMLAFESLRRGASLATSDGGPLRVEYAKAPMRSRGLAPPPAAAAGRYGGYPGSAHGSYQGY